MKTNESSMMNALKADFYKISKLKSVYIALGIMFLLTILNYILYWITLSLDMPVQQAGKSVLFSFSSAADIEFLVAIICGIFIGKEFSNGTIRTQIARGGDRVKLYFSKWITFMSLIVAYAMIMLVLSGILTAIKGYGMPFNGKEFGYLMRSVVFQLLALMSSTSIFIMLAFLCRSAGSAIGTSIGFYILVGVIVAIVQIVVTINADENAIMNSVTQIDNATWYLPLQQLSGACYAGEYTTENILQLIFMPIAYTAVSTFIGCYTFVKRDVK